MRLGLMNDISSHEKRVALVPEDVQTLVRHGFDVRVAYGAGEGSFINDHDYREAGAATVDASQVLNADVLVSLRNPESLETALADASAGAVLIGVFDPLWAPMRAQRLAEAGVSAFSLDLVPRVTRAQSMDVLSSMATIAGYEAVLLAASRLPQMFPLMMTAAGTLTPARVLVLGAGVAGLQAIATARRLGAVVEAYDVRAAALEQIRSMGARTVAVESAPEADSDEAQQEAVAGRDASPSAADDNESPDGYARARGEQAALDQQKLLAPHISSADVLITAASVPGRASPLLVTEAMIDSMKPGSVVVDLAAQRGGNCAVTRPDAEVLRNGVAVLGPTDLTSRSARHASQMFSRNLTAFLEHLMSDGSLVIDTDDEIVAAMLVTHGGEVVNPDVRTTAESRAAVTQSSR